MTEESLMPTIEALAAEYGLPKELVCAIITVESTWKTRATRFEPGFLKRYVLKIPGLGTEERKGRSISWGLMQVMGQVAREYGFVGPFEDLFIPKVGIKYGCKHLSNLKRRFFKKWGWSGVVAAFNAGSPRLKAGKYVNQEYVNDVKREWERRVA